MDEPVQAGEREHVAPCFPQRRARRHNLVEVILLVHSAPHRSHQPELLLLAKGFLLCWQAQALLLSRRNTAAQTLCSEMQCI